ncbi:MAG: hypothetical protein A2283_07865 [Lentisphaerae bacterium RIFOXYA12_FULL_48_11]|nr:MAG: hypothetical protein A2283_07865 [Lentisphaerae bacterium RIFOXYA12_FULL_48_11]
MRYIILLAAILMTSNVIAAQKKPAVSAPYKLAVEELFQVRSKTEELSTALKSIAVKSVDESLLADVEVYHKAAVWILRYADEEFYSKRYLADTLAALDHGISRAKELSAGQPLWPVQKGRLVRAYRSRVDGSVQPYGLAIPENYDGIKPIRLDVVLHGRGTSLNEISFIAGHDAGKPLPPEQDFIRLDVYGRGNNAYRWAGETDVFEAIESVKQRYKIDERQIVLRGFSMGGAGAWHIGLHHPDQWAAVEAGAGFTETKRYAKLESLQPCQEEGLHIYDAVDYSLNAFNLPVIGYGGEDDAQLQGSANIREQLAKEGFLFRQDGLNWLATDLSAIFLVGPKTGHKFHPESQQRSDQYIKSALSKKAAVPNHIRFVTYTMRYNKCFWMDVAGLEKHYQRAEVDVRRSDDGMRFDIKTHNVSRLILPDQPQGPKIVIDGREFKLTAHMHARPSELVLQKDLSGWQCRESSMEPVEKLRKRHSLQGPIDDAFMDSFMCVRPTGKPLHSLPREYTQETLGCFTGEFAKWMRGDVRVKDDSEVTPADMEKNNIILFGDPACNKLLEQITGKLPVKWDKDSITVGGKNFSSADHVLVMIYPNPLNPRRYVVINSGHTFHAKDFRGTNALLFPKIGDYAVLKIARGSDGKIETTVELTGFFDEEWKLLK